VKKEKTSSRILTFDLMRGYFLVAIILDHLYFFPSGLDIWSARGNMYVSAAEGFFILSGIVLGIVRGRKLIEKPFKVAAKLLLQRSLQLYIASIVLMLIFTLIGWQFLGNPGLKPGIVGADINPFQLIWGALTFQYLYGWADYLRLYAIFILFSPLALLLLRKGLWWVVLAISAVVWALFPLSPLGTAELSQVFSWQLVFFAGFVIGFHWDNILSWWRSLPLLRRKVIARVIISTSIVALIANIIIYFGGEFSPTLYALNEYLDKILFNKERLTVPRLALFALWFSAAFMLFRKFEPVIVKFFGWILQPFGTNSLYVYILQAFVIFFLHLYFTASEWYINLIISVFAVGIIWLATHYKFLMKIIPR